MKKLFALVFALVVFSNFVLAQVEFGDASSNFKERTNELSSREIHLSDNLKSVVEFVFGFEQGTLIEFQMFIVLVELFVLLLFLFYFAARIFFDSGVAWLISVGVVFFVSVVGTIKTIAVFFFGIGGLFSIFEDWLMLKLIFVVIVLFVLFFILLFFLGRISSGIRKQKAVVAGEDIKFLASVARSYREESN